MAFVAIDPDTDRPWSESGLADRSRERENEEEDGDSDDSELPGMGFVLPTCTRPASSRIGVAVANRWFLGSGPVALTPFLRC